MSYYGTDEDLAEFFDGETVPGDNTISESRNTRLKIRANNKINGITKSTSQMTDTYGDLKEIFLKLYKQSLDGEPMEISEPDEHLIIDRYGGLSKGGPPVIIHDFRDWDVNESG